MAHSEITVAAVTEADGRFLVVEELIEGRLVINQPAGHLEPGETLLEAVVREVREETAWHFTALDVVGIYLWRHPGSGRTFKRFAFAGEVTDRRNDQPLDEGIVATHWLSYGELRECESRLRSPLVLRCVEDYRRGQRQPLGAIAALDLAGAANVTALEL
jgi:phosphatase NudJ